MDVEECFSTLARARKERPIPLITMEKDIGVAASRARKAETGEPLDAQLSTVIKWAEYLGYEVQIVKKRN